MPMEGAFDRFGQKLNQEMGVLFEAVEQEVQKRVDAKVEQLQQDAARSREGGLAEHEGRERRLGEREQELEQRHAALLKDIEARETRLAEREAELEARERELVERFALAKEAATAALDVSIAPSRKGSSEAPQPRGEAASSRPAPAGLPGGSPVSSVLFAGYPSSGAASPAGPSAGLFGDRAGPARGAAPAPGDDSDGAQESYASEWAKSAKKPDATCSLDTDDRREQARSMVGQASVNAGQLRSQFEKAGSSAGQQQSQAREERAEEARQASLVSASTLRQKFEQQGQQPAAQPPQEGKRRTLQDLLKADQDGGR